MYIEQCNYSFYMCIYIILRLQVKIGNIAIHVHVQFNHTCNLVYKFTCITLVDICMAMGHQVT